MLPVGLLELMLHVEEPQPERGGRNGNGRLDHQIEPEADVGSDQQRHGEDAQMVEIDAEATLVLDALLRKALENQEDECRPESKQEKGIAEDAVYDPLGFQGREIFFDRECPDVADAAAALDSRPFKRMRFS